MRTQAVSSCGLVISGGAPVLIPVLLAPILDMDEALLALPLFPIATLVGALEVLAVLAAFKDATRPATPVLFSEADGDVERPFEVFSDNGAAAARASVDMSLFTMRKMTKGSRPEENPEPPEFGHLVDFPAESTPPPRLLVTDEKA